MESSEDEQEIKVSSRSPRKTKTNLQMVEVDINEYVDAEVWASTADEAELEASGKDQLEDVVSDEEAEQVPTRSKVRGQDDSDDDDDARKHKARHALTKPKSKVTALDDTDPIPEGYFEKAWIDDMKDPVNL